VFPEDTTVTESGSLPQTLVTPGKITSCVGETTRPIPESVST